MSATPYFIVLIIGIFIGAYAANLKFRNQVNAMLKSLMKKASKIDVERGMK